MSTVYLGDWSECGREGMNRDFNNYGEDIDFSAGFEVLLAWYGQECYSGEAFVLFRKDGALWEVNGSHCSCYGLEGQWSPEPTTAEALAHRLDKGKLGTYYTGTNLFASELRAVLARIAP